jgi:hypothetical protein
MLEIAFQVSRWAALAFLGAMLVIVILKMSGGTLNIGAITLGRGQLLVTTLGVAAAYAYMVMSTVKTGQLPTATPIQLPTATPMMLGLLGGSQGVHLSLKLAENWAALFGKS